MTVLDNAGDAAGAVAGNPLVLVGASLFALLKVPTFLLQINGLLYGLVALVLFPVTPFLLSGLYGLSLGALQGQANGEHYVKAGKDGYVRLLTANLLYAVVRTAISLVLTLVFVVLAVLLLGVTLSVGGMDSQAFSAGVLVALLLLLSIPTLVLFVLDFALQFYRVSAVVGGADATEAFKESVSIVSSNKVASLGFMLLRTFIVLLFVGTFGAVLYVTGNVSTLSNLDGGLFLALALVLAWVFGAALFAFMATYKVAFYRDVR